MLNLALAPSASNAKPIPQTHKISLRRDFQTYTFCQAHWPGPGLCLGWLPAQIQGLKVRLAEGKGGSGAAAGVAAESLPSPLWAMWPALAAWRCSPTGTSTLSSSAPVSKLPK